MALSVRSLASLLALLLVLLTGGVPQTLAAAVDTHADCAEEEGDDCTDCGECAPGCALCFCCPLRAAPPVVLGVRLPRVTSVDGPELAPKALLAGAGPPDIFHPPRA